MKEILIQQASFEELQEVFDFVLQSRKILFPMLSNDKLPQDLEFFKDYYFQQPQGCFLTARDSEGKLIGTIGMRSYDR